MSDSTAALLLPGWLLSIIGSVLTAYGHVRTTLDLAGHSRADLLRVVALNNPWLLILAIMTIGIAIADEI